jgi:hypothetical protein
MANEGKNDLIQFDGGALVADMLAESSAEDAQELSQYALEDGSTVNDHVVRAPRRMTLTLVQTESPLTAINGFAQVSRELSYPVRSKETQTTTLNVRKKEFRPTSLLGLTSGVREALFNSGPISVTGMKADGAVDQAPLKVTVLAAGADVGRVNEFHEQLIALLETVTPVQITVKQRSYPSMILTGVTRTDSAGQFGAARFTVQLQQVSTAETKIVELPPVPQATAKKNAGKKDGIVYDTQFGPPPPPATQLLQNLQETGVLSR